MVKKILKILSIAGLSIIPLKISENNTLRKNYENNLIKEEIKREKINYKIQINELNEEISSLNEGIYFLKTRINEDSAGIYEERGICIENLKKFYQEKMQLIQKRDSLAKLLK